MKAFIIDDEEAPRKILKYLIQKNIPEIEILGESNRLKEGMQAIENLNIDILFLDIEMPEHKGLEVLNFIKGDVGFEIIFITAYNQYAIDAIRLSAFDYLLKPINIDEFNATIERLKEKRKTEKGQTNQAIELLKNNLESSSDKIYLLRSHQKEYYIPLVEIYYLEADGMYTKIHFKDKKIIASKPLKTILEDLPNQFIRTHRSFAVNAENVSKPLKIKNNFVELTNNQKVPISLLNKRTLQSVLK